MGYYAHHAVLVHDGGTRDGTRERVEAFRAGLSPEWAALLVGPIDTVVNMAKVYVFLPDGSKEGWKDGDRGGELRAQFMALFEDTWADVALIRFGGDDRDMSSVTYAVGLHDG